MAQAESPVRHVARSSRQRLSLTWWRLFSATPDGPAEEVAVVGDRPDLVEVVQRRFLPTAVLAWGEPYDSPLWTDRTPMTLRSLAAGYTATAAADALPYRPPWVRRGCLPDSSCVRDLHML